MELHIYKGEFDLPSIDFDCLRVTAYVKLTNAPVTIITTGNPFFSPNWFLPYLNVDGKRRICGYEQIIKELVDRGFSIRNVPKDIQHLSDAYICLLIQNVYPCLRYYLWGDQQNLDTIRSLYARRMRFPLNFIFPQKYIKKTDSLIQIEANFSIDDKLEDHNVADLLLKAKKTLNLLSMKLKNSKCLLGTSYTEVDATIYALIATFYHIPISNNPLKSHINESPNLLQYINDFHKKFLKDLPVLENNTNDQSTKRTKTGINETDDDKYYSQLTPKIFAIFVAGLAMTAFALKNGIFHVSPNHPDRLTEIAYDDDDDDDNEPHDN